VAAFVRYVNQISCFRVIPRKNGVLDEDIFTSQLLILGSSLNVHLGQATLWIYLVEH